MGFDIHYNPTAQSLGRAAMSAGLGQYNLRQQARRDAIKAQERSINASAQAQQRQISAQAQNYADLRTFQGEQKEEDFRRQLVRDAIQAQRGEERAEFNMGLQQKQKTKDFVNNGWNQFVGSIKNLEDLNPAQQLEWQGIQNDAAKVLSNQALKDEEKELAVKQLVVKSQALLRSVVPKQKTKEQEWDSKGQGEGDRWIDEMTGRMMTRKGGIPQFLDDQSPTEARLDRVTKMVESHNAAIPEPLSPTPEEIASIKSRLASGALTQEAADALLYPQKKGQWGMAEGLVELKRLELLMGGNQQPGGGKTPPPGGESPQQGAVSPPPPQPTPQELQAAQQQFAVPKEQAEALQALGLPPTTKVPKQYEQVMGILSKELREFQQNPSPEAATALRRVLHKLRSALNAKGLKKKTK